MEIKFNLCEMFGVEEGQEFYINGRFKYKIEKGELLCCNPLSKKYFSSQNTINWLFKEAIVIEIIKKSKEVPQEIQEILNHCKALGCEFIAYHSFTGYWIGGEDMVQEINFKPDSEFIKWANVNLGTKLSDIAYIDDILAGNF